MNSRIYPRLHSGLNRRLRMVAGGRLARHCQPSSIMFLLTERCNARCLHCDIWKNRGKEDSPGFEGWSRTLREMRAWLGPVDLVFTGGEALLQPYTLDLIQFATGLGFGLEVLTHGYWEDQPRIERLALAGASRLTISVDGIGELHNRIRGREKFWERTSRSIETLARVRQERGLRYTIRLKTVVMSHNLEGVADVARYATSHGAEVFYQPIEQNYNTSPDQEWFNSTPNWPPDPERAVAAVQELRRLKKDEGLNIANTDEQLAVMIPYFRNPAGLSAVTQAHAAHLRSHHCSIHSMMQIQSNGDVRICAQKPVIGNIRETPLRSIWQNRPCHWDAECCLVQTASVKNDLPILQETR